MTFWQAISWGLPAGVVVAGGLALMAHDPDSGLLSSLGIAVVFVVAVVLMFFTREKR